MTIEQQAHDFFFKITDYNIMINGLNFFDQSVKIDMRTFRKLQLF